MTKVKLTSWGRIFRNEHDVRYLPTNGTVNLSKIAAQQRKNKSILPFGLGRSYGDSNINADGALLRTERSRRILSADWKTGIIRAEAGLSLDELLQICVPKGWFIPVTPGTKFVTLGGAVANDVHGKNHHVVGSFGTFVNSIGLQRSDKPTSEKKPITCSPTNNKELFYLTLGGLGLTGLIRWVEFRLSPIASSFLEVENIPYANLDEFFALSKENADWPYCVAWVDCFSKGKHLGRGVFSRAKFAGHGALKPHEDEKKINWPMETPAFLLNKTSIKIFNWLYRKRPSSKSKRYEHYDSFFFPLDRIRNWNKLYGKKGFYQFQCIVPSKAAPKAITALLEHIERSGQGSFLAVLKDHGPEQSGGIMSFCREGVSLALDFANKGQITLDLLRGLEEITDQNGGRTYPAKDGHMSSDFYQKSYPDWKLLEKRRDPVISSSFWRRVTKKA